MFAFRPRRCSFGHSNPPLIVAGQFDDGFGEIDIVPRADQYAGFAACDNLRHAAPISRHHGQARRRRFQENHAERFVHRGPHQEVGCCVKGDQILRVLLAGKEYIFVADRAQRLLNMNARLAVAGDEQLPGRIGDQVEGAAQQAVGRQLIAGAHHGDAQQPRAIDVEAVALGEHGAVALAIAICLAVGRRVEKGRHAVQAGRAFHHWLQSFLVFRGERQNGIGTGDGVQRRLEAGGVGPAGLLARVRRFGGDIRNVERRTNRRPKPIRRLVVEMVGKP